MMVLISLLIWTFVLYAVFMQVREYNRLVYSKFRFRYFAMRDKLAMLVVNGSLDEDSWEYKEIISLINYHISAIESISITRILSLIVQYHMSQEGKTKVEMIKLKTQDRKVAGVMAEFFTTTYDLVQRNSRMQLLIVKLMHIALFSPEMRRRHGIIDNPREALLGLNSQKRSFEAVATA